MFTKCQIDGEDFVNFCGLLKKHEYYLKMAIFCCLNFVFSKKTTKIEEIFTFDLILTTQCQTDGEDFVNFCGLVRKHEL